MPMTLVESPESMVEGETLLLQVTLHMYAPVRVLAHRHRVYTILVKFEHF